MNKIAAVCLSLVCLLPASLHARADVVIVVDVDIACQNPAEGDPMMARLFNITLEIKGDKIRVGLFAKEPVSLIIDGKTGGMILFRHALKKFEKISGEKTKSLMEKPMEDLGRELSRIMAADSTGAPKIEDTGIQSKVGDYNTEVYKVETQGRKFTFLITKDIPNYAAIREQTKKLPGLQLMLGLALKIDGMAAEVVCNDGRQTLTMTLVSVKEEAVDDAEFQIPADYTEEKAQPSPAPGGAATPPPGMTSFDIFKGGHYPP